MFVVVDPVVVDPVVVVITDVIRDERVTRCGCDVVDDEKTTRKLTTGKKREYVYT